MPYRKRTLRQLTPQARKLAKLVGDLESVTRRLKPLVPVIQELELWQRAEAKRQAHFRQTDKARSQEAGRSAAEDLFG